MWERSQMNRLTHASARVWSQKMNCFHALSAVIAYLYHIRKEDHQCQQRGQAEGCRAVSRSAAGTPWILPYPLHSHRPPLYQVPLHTWRRFNALGQPLHCIGENRNSLELARRTQAHGNYAGRTESRGCSVKQTSKLFMITKYGIPGVSISQNSEHTHKIWCETGEKREEKKLNKI